MAVLVAWCSACGPEFGPMPAGAPTSMPPPSFTVRVSSGNLALPVGETLKLNVTVVDASGAPVAGVDALEWSVDAPTIATVKDGLLTTHSPGTAKVTVTAYVTRLGQRAEGVAVVEVTEASSAAGRCGDGTCSMTEMCQCLNDCGACSGGPTSLFTSVSPSDPTARTEGRPVAVGVKFRVAAPGRIRALRFFKGTGGAGTNRLALFSGTGQSLAQVTSRNETLSGWQTVNLSNAVTVMPGTTYVVTLHSSTGHVVSAGAFFARPMVQGALRALADGEDGPNGLFHPSTALRLPTESRGPFNYFVDVVFEPMP
jgi:hypothetical protein